MIRLIVALMMVACPAWALSPDELLDDPGLESRARALGQELRCVVCQNESIDSSEVPLARDMRALVRDRLVAGDSDDQIRAYMHDRYGDFVLMTPRTEGAGLAVWVLPPIVMIFGVMAVALYFRSRFKRRRRR